MTIIHQSLLHFRSLDTSSYIILTFITVTTVWMCLFPCVLPSNEDSWKYLACLIGDKYYIVAFKMFLSQIADRDKHFYKRLLLIWILWPIWDPNGFYFFVYLYKIFVPGCRLWGHQPSAFENLLIMQKHIAPSWWILHKPLQKRLPGPWPKSSSLVLHSGSVAWLKNCHSLIQPILTEFLCVVDDG